jgi:hypothetical protein
MSPVKEKAVELTGFHVASRIWTFHIFWTF